MEYGTTESIFQRIISTPGLSHIADLIFFFLDAKTVILCTDVCSYWKWYIINTRLLRRHVLNNKHGVSCFSSAPERSHNRQLLKRLLGPKFKTKLDEEVDTEEEFNAFKTFVDHVDPNNIEKRLKSGPLPRVKV